jgi:hypothetical protein
VHFLISIRTARSLHSGTDEAISVSRSELRTVLQTVSNPAQYPQCFTLSHINPLAPNDLQRRRAVSPLKIKTLSKNMREKPTNTPIIYSVY